MSPPDRRARLTGRQGTRRGDVYAQIPDEVLRSEACRALPDYAVRVLLLMAAQYRGPNNGDLAVTSRAAREYGLPEWKLRAGLSLLETSGLLELKRQGQIMKGKGIPSLYALGWRQVDPSDKYDSPTVVAVPAPNRWARWSKPIDWKAQEAARRHAAQGNRNRQPWSKEIAHPTRVR